MLAVFTSLREFYPTYRNCGKDKKQTVAPQETSDIIGMLNYVTSQHIQELLGAFFSIKNAIFNVKESIICARMG